MPSKRLEEAMKATKYTNQTVAKASEHTGKAFEEPKPVYRKVKPEEPRESPPEGVKDVRKKSIYQKPGRRVTTAREANGDFSDEADEREGGGSPVQPPALPPDPFPLQYRDGDPDAEFEGE